MGLSTTYMGLKLANPLIPSAYERGNYIKALTSYGPTSTFE